jgi:hypothetical protein
MENVMRTVPALLLEHLLTDFVFEASALVRQKKSGRAMAYLASFAAVAMGLTLVHLAIDGIKIG